MSEPFARNPAILLVEDEPDILIILHRLMRDLTAGMTSSRSRAARRRLRRSLCGQFRW